MLLLLPLFVLLFLMLVLLLIFVLLLPLFVLLLLIFDGNIILLKSTILSQVGPYPNIKLVLQIFILQAVFCFKLDTTKSF